MRWPGDGAGGARDKTSDKEIWLSSLSSSFFSFFSTLFQVTCQIQMIISACFPKMQLASLKGEQYYGSPEKVIYDCLTNVIWTWGLQGGINLWNHYLFTCDWICSFIQWVIHQTLYGAVYSVHNKFSLSTSWIPGSMYTVESEQLWILREYSLGVYWLGDRMEKYIEKDISTPILI